MKYLLILRMTGPLHCPRRSGSVWAGTHTMTIMAFHAARLLRKRKSVVLQMKSETENIHICLCRSLRTR